MRTIILCMKITYDTSQLRASSATGEPRLENAPQRISTLDEHALETAVRLKEKHGGKVIAVSLSAKPPPPELILRALAMGADEAYLIEEATADATRIGAVLPPEHDELVARATAGCPSAG